VTSPWWPTDVPADNNGPVANNAPDRRARIESDRPLRTEHQDGTASSCSPQTIPPTTGAQIGFDARGDAPSQRFSSVPPAAMQAAGAISPIRTKHATSCRRLIALTVGPGRDGDKRARSSDVSPIGAEPPFAAPRASDRRWVRACLARIPGRSHSPQIATVWTLASTMPAPAAPARPCAHVRPDPSAPVGAGAPAFRTWDRSRPACALTSTGSSGSPPLPREGSGRRRCGRDGWFAAAAATESTGGR
jgi:hypothetical protein